MDNTDEFDAVTTTRPVGSEVDADTGRQVMVPTLSSWATRLDEQADALMAFYLMSEYSQSAQYLGNVSSLPYHLRLYGKDPTKLKDRLQVHLGDYFDRHFDTSEVEVSVPVNNNATEGSYEVSIRVAVARGDNRYDIGRLISVSQNRVQRIQNV